MSDDGQKAGSPRIQLHMDDSVSQGTYSNLVVINHTENEFVVDFAYLQPQSQHAKVRSRIISSPRHTKRMLLALQKNLERYEARYGVVELSTDDDPIIH
ncbi:MAG: DUF3467 domain-containing protein [Polyangia bacterium]